MGCGPDLTPVSSDRFLGATSHCPIARRISSISARDAEINALFSADCAEHALAGTEKRAIS
jgi:hypothetical protein